MARSALLNVMVQAALKAGKSLSRDASGRVRMPSTSGKDATASRGSVATPTRWATSCSTAATLSVSLGTAISGLLAPFYDPQNEVPYFSILGAIAIVLGIALAAARKPVLALMRGVR